MVDEVRVGPGFDVFVNGLGVFGVLSFLVLVEVLLAVGTVAEA